MSNNVAPAIEELRRAFAELKPWFDERLGERIVFDGKQGKWVTFENPVVNMPMPIITIQSRGRKKVDGWYKPSAWDNPAATALNTLANMGGGNNGQVASTDEICLAAEAMDQPNEKILTTLVHQMVHHYARHNRRGEETQNGNGYHSRTFVRLAATVGLDAEADGSRGYANTSVQLGTVGRQLTERFDQVALDRNAFDMHRKGLAEAAFKGSKLKKWSCDCTNIRSAVYIEAHCQICDKDFAYSDKDKEDQNVIDMLESGKKQLDTVQALNNGVRKPHWRNAR